MVYLFPITEFLRYKKEILISGIIVRITEGEKVTRRYQEK